MLSAVRRLIRSVVIYADMPGDHLRTILYRLVDIQEMQQKEIDQLKAMINETQDQQSR